VFGPDFRRKPGRCAAALTASLLFAATWAASAQVATEYRLTPSADTTIFAEQSDSSAYDSVSDGSGPNLWTAVIAAGVTRRALLRFDLSAIPPGSRVISARVELFVVRARDEHSTSLHRVLASWGEGGSNGGDAGVGAPAQPGDATWSHRFWPQQPWTQRGGDFVASASASRLVGFGPASYAWSSTPQLVADVQEWLTQPAANHGWILIGDDQGLQNAKRLVSRNSATDVGRPLLIISVEPPPPANVKQVPLPGWALAVLGAGLAAVIVRRRRR